MVKNIKIVIGANFGDEGKGLFTDYICKQYISKTPIVIRDNGGCQSGHTVVRDGKRIVFSHFGSGSLLGVPTFLTSNFIINPIFFADEWNKIYRLCPNLKVFVDANTRVSTPYDVLINQIKEIYRNQNAHGSTGKGIYETINRYEEVKQSYYLKDLYKLSYNEIKDYLLQISNYLYKKNKVYFEHNQNKEIESLIEIYNNNDLIDSYINDFIFMKDHIELTNYYEIVSKYETHIFEMSQGLLLDKESHLYMPHCTPSNTGSKNPLNNIINNLTDFNDVEIELIYVSRSYMTRHGAGEFFSECDMKDINKALKDLTNAPNRFQGNLRYGFFDAKETLRSIFSDYNYFIQALKRRVILSICITHLNETSNNLIIGKNLYIEPESLFKYLFNKRYYSIGEDNNKDIICLE